MSAPRSKRSWRRPVVAGVAALTVLLAGCSEPEVFGSSEVLELDSPSPDEAAKPERGVPRTDPAGDDIEPATMIFVVRGEDGDALSDVRIELRREGTKKVEKLITGPKGEVKIVRRPAVYHLNIPAGCVGAREINEGERARIGVIEGRRHRINLNVKARRRYVAGPPLTSSLDAPWPAGRAVKLNFGIFDRCKDRNAPGVSYDSLRWRAGGPIEVTDPGPMRANKDSMGTVTVRCTGAGDARLWLQDRDAPSDRVDILSFRPPVGFSPDTAWCRA